MIFLQCLSMSVCMFICMSVSSLLTSLLPYFLAGLSHLQHGSPRRHICRFIIIRTRVVLQFLFIALKDLFRPIKIEENINSIKLHGVVVVVVVVAAAVVAVTRLKSCCQEGN